MIDPITLSKFLQLDGASDLIAAFAEIPEGPMRESIVHLARTTAATYAASLPAGKSAPPPQIERKAPVTADATLKAVQLMLEGSSPAQAAEATGLDIKAILAARKTAKRHGATFPKVRMAAKVIELHPKPKTKSKAGQKRNEPKFPLTVEALSPRGLMGAQATARVLQISVEVLMLKKAEAVALFNRGETGAAVARHLGVPQKMVENWKTLARHAGLISAATVQAAV